MKHLKLPHLGEYNCRIVANALGASGPFSYTFMCFGQECRTTVALHPVTKRLVWMEPGEWNTYPYAKVYSTPQAR